MIWFLGGHPPQAKHFKILDNPYGIIKDGPTLLPETGLYNHGAVLLNDWLILTGGQIASETYNNKTYIYDLKSSTWTIRQDSLPTYALCEYVIFDLNFKQAYSNFNQIITKTFHAFDWLQGERNPFLPLLTGKSNDLICLEPIKSLKIKWKLSKLNAI